VEHSVELHSTEQSNSAAYSQGVPPCYCYVTITGGKSQIQCDINLSLNALWPIQSNYWRRDPLTPYSVQAVQ